MTTADSLLGEGVAELLAEEFTGEGGPRAVHMGTALRAWRRAGGGLRSPLSQPEGIRLARQLGAGLLVEGAIVGLGQQITLSASVVTVPGGVARRAPPVSGHSDSLPNLLGRLAAGVLSAAGGAGGAAPAVEARGARLTDSPVAIRAYIEGLADFRRGKFTTAAVHFERAFAADTLFARTAFMRWVTATWGPGFGSEVQALWSRRARTLRPRLSALDQVVLDAAFGDFAAKERATQTASESPEVFYFLGDALYHPARSLGWTLAIARARAAFERSLAIDTQATSLQHLIEIGLLTSDLALLRVAWPAFDRLREEKNPVLGWIVAARLGDGRMLDELRRRPWPSVAVGDLETFFLGWAPQAGVPATLLDELHVRLRSATPDGGVPLLRSIQFYALSLQGRYRSADRLAREGPVVDTVFLTRGFTPDLWLAVAAAIGDGDTSVGTEAVERLRRSALPDSQMARARCAVGLWDALVRDSTVHDDGAMRSHGQSSCAELLDVITAGRAGLLDSARLARSDSIVRRGPVLFPYSGVGPLLMARAWGTLGIRSRALVNARAHSNGFFSFTMAAMRREEARLAALEGDAAGAIRVYREYLDLRRDAEPALVPQRDSVRAELARLERRP